MRIYNYFIPLITVYLLFLWACNDDERMPLIADSTIPAQVSNIQVERLPGAVKLTYDLPDDQVLSYIQAECVINGILRQVKSSTYLNNLIIQGFSDTINHQVKIYSVSRSEKISEPVTIDVKPLSPPFQDVFKSLSLFADFGGASVSFENPQEADLAITLMYIDSTGYWTTGETSYTKKLKGTVSQRNLDTIPTTFGVYLRDRWNNMTDTIISELTPMYEEKLDRNKFRQWNLPGDEPSAFGWTLPKLWDGSTAETFGFHTNGTTWPQWVTIDLGVTAKLSRVRTWQRRDYGLEFADRNVKRMEIWGSLDPNPDGSWDDSWTYLTTTESVKPSGLPSGQLSDEDRQLTIDGEEFMFPTGIPATRYIRLKILDTWSGAKNQWFLMEVALWGAEEK